MLRFRRYGTQGGSHLCNLFGMLAQTFCHIQGIGATTEARLWAAGVHSWDQAKPEHPMLQPTRFKAFQHAIDQSRHELANSNADFFGSSLPAGEQWRLYREFREQAAYIDIETTGLGRPGDHITTIALYDGRQVRHYVHGDNISQFKRDIANYKLLVSYNGKCFDVPFIETALKCRLPQAHIDLRYVLKSLGIQGGLKACERTLGFSRPGLQDVDGFFAVLLWHEFKRTGNDAALETLLAYNVEDVLMLERLATLAYNRKVAVTPFADSHRLSDAVRVQNPFTPDARLIDRLRKVWMNGEE